MTATVEILPFLPTLTERYRQYSVYILGHRHFAEGRDGLKPVQRRSVWAMHDLKSYSEAQLKLTSKIVGHCFAAGTPVSTTKGLVPIEMLEVGDAVRTSRGNFRITATFENPPTSMLNIDVSNGRRVICTVDQEFKVRVGDKFFWKRASELCEGDEVVTLS